MNKIDEYINSGILEMYVLGMTSLEETKDVNDMASLHEEIRVEIDEISKTLQIHSSNNTARKPNPTLNPYVLAVVDYTERLKAGEPMTFPPLLNKDSKVIDFAEWTSRKDMILPADSEEMFAKIIGYTPEATTTIAWIKKMTPFEIHHNEFERFLILEGTCDITIGEDLHQLVAGDFIEIPLYLGHSLVVTSDIPCKVILQRVAA
jgi:mannose-6-phosphate isomerase-like protein (cupin superfamily)